MGLKNIFMMMLKINSSLEGYNFAKKIVDGQSRGHFEKEG